VKKWFILAITFYIAGCGGGGDYSNIEDTELKQIVGKWQKDKPCKVRENGSASEILLEFTKEKYLLHIKEYSDDICSQENLKNYYIFDNNFTLGKYTKFDNNTTARELDIVCNKIIDKKGKMSAIIRCSDEYTMMAIRDNNLYLAEEDDRNNTKENRYNKFNKDYFFIKVK
jgi:hypothetical protein